MKNMCVFTQLFLKKWKEIQFYRPSVTYKMNFEHEKWNVIVLVSHFAQQNKHKTTILSTKLVILSILCVGFSNIDTSCRKIK